MDGRKKGREPSFSALRGRPGSVPSIAVSPRLFALFRGMSETHNHIALWDRPYTWEIDSGWLAIALQTRSMTLGLSVSLSINMFFIQSI